MANGRPGAEIVRLRNEMLVALSLIYPAALQAEQIMRILLSVFPDLEWRHFKRDLCYLVEKGYIQRVISKSETESDLTPWRKRWFRITTGGMDIADQLVNDPALNE